LILILARIAVLSAIFYSSVSNGRMSGAFDCLNHHMYDLPCSFVETQHPLSTANFILV
jgi:hypothetical protein